MCQNRRTGLVVGLAVCAGLTFGGRGLAQDEKPGEISKNADQAKKTVNDEFWNASAIMKAAVRNIARRYNLNEEQTAFTDEMLTVRTTRFLEEHQNEIWPLVRDLALLQRKGSGPDVERAKTLGPVALKIIKDAQEEIFSSNDEWREILTDEQKRVHDYDMREMHKSFAQMEDTFEQWSEGKTTGNSIFPPPPPVNEQPPRPDKPSPGMPLDDTRDERGVDIVNQYEVYVNEFIAKYHLDARQIEAARSIQREIMQRAGAFKTANREELEAIKAAFVKAKNLKERRDIKARLSAKTQPLDDLFAELKERLDKIPDQAQRDRANQEQAEPVSEKASSKSAVSGAKSRRAEPKPSGDKTPAAGTTESKDDTKDGS